MKIPKPVQAAWDAGEKVASGFGCLPLASLATGLTVCVGAILLRPSYSLATVLALAVAFAYLAGRTAWHSRLTEVRRRRDTSMRLCEHLARELTAARAQHAPEPFEPPGDASVELTTTMPAIGAEELDRRV